MAENTTRKSRKWLLIAGLAVILLAAAAFAVWTWGTCTVTWNCPDGTAVARRTVKGFAVSAPESPAAEGWTFVGWTDTDGNFLPAGGVKPRENTAYTAVMMPALETEAHAAYLTLTDLGLFCPDDALTVAEGEAMLRRLISVDWPEPFLAGNDGDPVTVRMLIGALASLYPAAETTPVIDDLAPDDADYAAFCTAVERGWLDAAPADDAGTLTLAWEPDDPVTRGAAAVLMNRVLERSRPDAPEEAMTGVIPDVSPDHPLYAQIAEAVVEHTYEITEAGDESWTSGEAIPRQEAGLVTIGGQMYCIGEDGYLVKNGTWGNFAFDKNGVYTSGMPELDVLVQAVLAEICDDSMTRMEKLRAAYDYTVSSFTYLRRNYYDFRETGWGEQEAYTMLSTGYGNCYCYAATFYELARALGYDPVLISGYVAQDRCPHGWVEIEQDGEMYVCDPELEMTYHRDRPDYIPDMFMMPYSKAQAWSYVR